jgi:hypothetical protein
MNTREQGDLGEISAIEWLGNQGLPVYLPIGHSPDVDLVTAIDGRLVGVQVKTTTMFRNGRWEPMIATRGGNQSWGGVAKQFHRSRCDYLFVLVGDGRRWFIPSDRIEATTGLRLGGPKYAPYEIERGCPILRAAA